MQTGSVVVGGTLAVAVLEAIADVEVVVGGQTCNLHTREDVSAGSSVGGFVPGTLTLANSPLALTYPTLFTPFILPIDWVL